MRPHTFAAFFIWYLRRFNISVSADYEVELKVASSVKYYRVQLVSDSAQEMRLRIGGAWGCDITFRETVGNPYSLQVQHNHGDSSNIEESIKLYDLHKVYVTYSGHPKYAAFEFDLGDPTHPEKFRQNYFYGVSSSAQTVDGTQYLTVNYARKS